MFLITRLTSTVFRLPSLRSQCQQLLSNKPQCNNVFLLFGSHFTRRTFFKRPNLSRPTEALSRNDLKEDWRSSALPMRYVFVNTCEKRYDDIPDGFFFDTGYVDSHPGSPYNPNIPLIFAIHDMHGGHETLLPLLAPLVLKNYRVIAINLPNSNHTNGLGFGHDDGFLHTTDECAEFIGDFLQELKIPKVDLMLSYGTGCYPLLRILSKSDLCQSAVFVCPAGHILFKGIQPYKFFELFVELWDIPFLRPFLKAVASLVKHLKGLGKYTTDEIIDSFKIIRGIDFNNIGSYLFQLKLKKFPVGVLYCQKDPFIESKISENFCKILGLEDGQTTFYNKQAEITKKAALHSPSQAIVVDERPRDICENFRLPIINMVEKLVNLIHRRT